MRDRLFSRWVAGSFRRFGSDTLIQLPFKVNGAERIGIGSGVHIGAGSWFHAVGSPGCLEIGDGCTMSGMDVLSATESVRLGRSVLLGRNVYIADHNHGRSDPGIPIKEQQLEDIAPVSIEDGAWLGQNVVVLSGVTVGRNAVIGANSVVTDDVPAQSLAVGAPAHIVSP